MNKHKKAIYNYDTPKKENTFLYELALQRGKSRGWYPTSWNLKDYEDYLFKCLLKNC